MKKVLIFLLIAIAMSFSGVSSSKALSSSSIQSYDRTEWMPSWSVGPNHSCIDVREADLIARGTAITYSGKCAIKSGLWVDAYTDSTFKVASALDIDHIVPLADAHASGGYLWGRDKRLAFAYDTANHAITTAHLNRSKGDKTPLEWLPPKHKCVYIGRYIDIKTKYSLAFDKKVLTLRDSVCRLKL